VGVEGVAAGEDVVVGVDIEGNRMEEEGEVAAVSVPRFLNTSLNFTSSEPDHWDMTSVKLSVGASSFTNVLSWYSKMPQSSVFSVFILARMASIRFCTLQGTFRGIVFIEKSSKNTRITRLVPTSIMLLARVSGFGAAGAVLVFRPPILFSLGVLRQPNLPFDDSCFCHR
jgi:hypothetical protein